MAENTSIRRDDLIGATGSVTRHFKVIDAKEYNMGGRKTVDIRVREDDGEEYWTGLEDVDLDI